MIKYNNWVKNLPKGLILPRARYDNRNLLKDINININVSGFNMSSFVPTAPIRQPRREYVDPRYETSGLEEIRRRGARHEQMLQEARERRRARAEQGPTASLPTRDDLARNIHYSADDIEVESRRSPIFSLGSLSGSDQSLPPGFAEAHARGFSSSSSSTSTSSTITTGSSAPSSQVLDDDIPFVDPNVDIFTSFSQTRREEIDAQDRAPQLQVEEIWNPVTNRWNKLNTQHGRKVLREHPDAERRFV